MKITNKMNILKEKCGECRGSGCNTLVNGVLCFLIKPELVEELCESCNGKDSCPNCEDGWVWKFSKVRVCPDCEGNGHMWKNMRVWGTTLQNCGDCNGTGSITEPVKDGEIELKIITCKYEICNAWNLIKELLDDGWGLK